MCKFWFSVLICEKLTFRLNVIEPTQCIKLLLSSLGTLKCIPGRWIKVHKGDIKMFWSFDCLKKGKKNNVNSLYSVDHNYIAHNYKPGYNTIKWQTDKWNKL